MQSDKVLCTCFKCKNETDNIGKYVHPTTKWRHEKKYNPTGDYEVGFSRLYYLRIMIIFIVIVILNYFYYL